MPPGKNLDPGDAYTYRITLLYPDQGMSGATRSVTKEVVALYHQSEDGFIVFKDNSHAAVFTVTSANVLEIERLRTHCILAVADNELRLIISALREQADRVNRDEATSDTASTVTLLSHLADALTRLVPVAADRAAQDPSSMPRVTTVCTCGVMTGGARSDDLACPMHHKTPELAFSRP